MSNVEIVTDEQIRERMAALLEKHPELLSFEPPACGCGAYCGDWEGLGPGGAQAADEMNTWQWLLGGEKWGWLPSKP